MAMAAPAEPQPLLAVRDLRVAFGHGQTALTAVDGVDFDVAPGEVLGLAGESGSGKSLTLRSILRLVHAPGHVSGKVQWRGQDLLTMPEAELRRAISAKDAVRRGLRGSCA